MPPLKSNTVSPSLCPAKTMSSERKKRIGMDVMMNTKTITCLANENNTSRKFIRQQGRSAQEAIDNVFDIGPSSSGDVLYHLPITKAWITQLVIALMLLGHTPYRNIAMIVKDLFDYDISEGTIHTIFIDAVDQARTINSSEQLSSIEVTGNDELFHHNKPVLSGIDGRSLYCYLLASENRRDEDTWAIHLFDTQAKGLSPTRTIGDDASRLVSGHKMVFPGVPYDYYHFHLSRSLMNLRRYFRNRLKSTITASNTLEKRSNRSIEDTSLAEQVLLEKSEANRIQYISGTIDTLVS
jgi:hypothetical protein